MELTQNYAAQSTSGMGMGIWTLLLLLITSATGVMADFSYNSTVLRFDNMTSTISAITEYTNTDPDTTDYILSIDYKLIGISNFTLDPTNDTPSGITKRRGGSSSIPLGSSWTEYQLMQQDTWWSQWYPASCAHPGGSGGGFIPVTQSTSYSASWNDGFSFSFGAAAASDMGYTVTQTNSVSQAVGRGVPVHSVGQAWQHQLVVWKDQIFRSCEQKYIGPDGAVCDDWSGYVRGNLPVQNGQFLVGVLERRKLTTILAVEAISLIFPEILLSCFDLLVLTKAGFYFRSFNQSICNLKFIQQKVKI